VSRCLVAGLRAAGLPRRVRVELSGHSCPRARRRHARTSCGRWPSCQARRAGVLRAAMSPRAALGYQTTAPGERARTRERNTRLWPARIRRAPCWATGQPSRQGRRRSALSSRGVSNPYSPPTRVARLIGPGFDPCVIAGARRARRDAPAAEAASPGTGSTRRSPRARPRTRAPDRLVHPSAEQRLEHPPGGGVWAIATRTKRRRRAARPLRRLGISSSTRCANFC
jgi:hypothetical protein